MLVNEMSKNTLRLQLLLALELCKKKFLKLLLNQIK